MHRVIGEGWRTFQRTGKRVYEGPKVLKEQHVQGSGRDSVKPVRGGLNTGQRRGWGLGVWISPRKHGEFVTERRMPQNEHPRSSV